MNYLPCSSENWKQAGLVKQSLQGPEFSYTSRIYPGKWPFLNCGQPIIYVSETQQREICSGDATRMVLCSICFCSQHKCTSQNSSRQTIRINLPRFQNFNLVTDKSLSCFAQLLCLDGKGLDCIYPFFMNCPHTFRISISSYVSIWMMTQTNLNFANFTYLSEELNNAPTSSSVWFTPIRQVSLRIQL